MIKKTNKYFLLIALVLQLTPFCRAMEKEETKEETQEPEFHYFAVLPHELQAEILKSKIEEIYEASRSIDEFRNGIMELILLNKASLELFRFPILQEFIRHKAEIMRLAEDLIVVIRAIYETSQSEEEFSDTVADVLNRASLELRRSPMLQEFIKNMKTQKFIEVSDPVDVNDYLINESYAGNTDEVLRLLDLGIHINTQGTSSKDTVLTSAISNGQIELAKILIKNESEDEPADVNLANDYGRTPLMYAAERGYSEIVQMLLEKNANVDPQDSQGFTALMLAVDNNYPDIVQLLLNAKADINLRTKNGDTALNLAHYKGNESIIEMLNVSDYPSQH